MMYGCPDANETKREKRELKAVRVFVRELYFPYIMTTKRARLQKI